MREIQYEIVKEIAVLSTGDSGYTKEINLISWNGKEPNFNQSFLSAFWTIKGIILQNSVLPNFITGFAPTNRTQYPFAFHHN